MKLKNFLKEIQGRSVFVLGDCMLDRYIFGEVHRISPEAPVPVVRVTKEEIRAGGAANVALNIKSLQGRPHLIGAIGKDKEGQDLKKILRKNGVSFSFLESASHPTISKTRVIAHQQQIVRIDCENYLQARENRSKLFPHHFPDSFEALCFSDYQKGFLQKNFVRAWIAAARKRKIPVCADPKPEDLLFFQHATVISPNLPEAEQIVGFRLTEKKAFLRAAQIMEQKFQVEKVLITLGKEGMFSYEKGKSQWIPAFAREVYDVTGAGDTVLASLSLALAAHIPFFIACRFANLAAAVVVQKLGTAVATHQELLDLEKVYDGKL